MAPTLKILQVLGVPGYGASTQSKESNHGCHLMLQRSACRELGQNFWTVWWPDCLSLRVTLWCDEAFICFPMIPSHTIHKASDGAQESQEENKLLFQSFGCACCRAGAGDFVPRGTIFTWLVGTLFGGPSKILSNFKNKYRYTPY